LSEDSYIDREGSLGDIPPVMSKLPLLLTFAAACGLSTEDTSDAGLHPAHPDGAPGSPDGAPGSSGTDGTPTRKACTSSFGTALSAGFGRLDGYLVAIVPLGASGCHGDSNHVHLQVEMNSKVYDVAVNVDGNFDEGDLALPDGAWSEGWHGSVQLDYPTLGIHSGAFQTLGLSQTAQKIESELAQANHISVFMQSYTGTDAGSGGHLVHRYGGSHDGAIVIRPLDGTAHALFFDFATSGSF
jgi:hypothetical protein